MELDRLADGLVTMRPFVPAKDFAQSCAFYEALGFTLRPIGDKLALLQFGDRAGAFAFLLQDYYVKEFAENFMMHVLVGNLDDWWRHIESLDLSKRFGVGAPRAPKTEPWGLRVTYVFDPAGVLWHFAEETQA